VFYIANLLKSRAAIMLAYWMARLTQIATLCSSPIDRINKAKSYRAQPNSPAATAHPTATRLPATLLGAVFALWLVPAGIDVVLWLVFVDVPIANAEFALVLVDGTEEMNGIVGTANVEVVVDVPVS
jgi:hypothetical protein